MMNTAAFIHGARDVRVGDHVPGVPDDDEVLVDVVSVGVCGSDLHYYKDGGIGSAVIQAPFVPGHEFSARLCADLPRLELARGALVAVDPARPCHRCEWCVRGHHNLCPRVRFLGAPPFNGALTQRLAVPIDSVIALPEGMSADQGAMLEPLGVCIHALDLARPTVHESVAVLGCGPIGLGIVDLLRLAGVRRIVAIDPQAHRTALAQRLGAHHVGTMPEAVAQCDDGLGCELVIEATNSPHGFRDAIRCSRIGARLVLVGIPDGDTYTALAASEARRRGLTVRFSRRMGNVYPRAIELVRGARVDVDALISHRFTLDGAPQAFALQANETPGLIKSIVYPAGSDSAAR